MLHRYWINQPSTAQQHHNLHGENVLVEEPLEDYPTIYFTSGKIVSMIISRLALSKGWKV